MGGSRGGDRGYAPHPLKNHQNIGFLSNTGPDPLKNSKAIKPAFNVWSSSARQRNRWRTDDGPLIVVFGSSHQQKTKQKERKNAVKAGHPLTKLSGSAHVARRSKVNP